MLILSVTSTYRPVFELTHDMLLVKCHVTAHLGMSHLGLIKVYLGEESLSLVWAPTAIWSSSVFSWSTSAKCKVRGLTKSWNRMI